MSDNVTRFPLSWPTGWKRSTSGGNKPPRFSDHGRAITVSRATDRLQRELGRLGARSVLLSSNLELGMRGDPLSNQREPSDRGVAVYFKLSSKDRVLACDRWTSVAGNIAAIAAHIDAIRRVDRYGVGTLDQAFAGYDALPAPGADNRASWRKVLMIAENENCSAAAIQAAYRDLAREAHPDVPGGSHDRMAELNRARDAALREIGS